MHRMKRNPSSFQEGGNWFSNQNKETMEYCCYRFLRDWEIRFESIHNHLRRGKESIHLILYRDYGSVLEADIGHWGQH